MEGEWLGSSDALKQRHWSACYTLDVLIRDDEFRKCLCYGKLGFGSDDDLCLFHHEANQLSPLSTVTISSIGEYCTEMSLAELYYYMHLAYQRFVEDGQPQDVLDEFAAGLDHFRTACQIKCDENGNPTLDGSSRT